MENYHAVVLDIEGTITPITFVKDILFPYVTQGLDALLKRQWSSSDLSEHIEQLRKQAAEDVKNSEPSAVLVPSDGSDDEIKQAIIKNIGWQMEADRKIGALKAFQGYIWKEGYISGQLRGEVYPDVIPKLDQWQSAGKKIHLYSSGSAPAQKLLVGYSNKGDLMKYFFWLL